MAELGMAFGGLVLGYVVVAAGMSAVGLGSGPLALLAGPLITGVAAAFYGKIGPLWAAMARGQEDEPDPDPAPWHEPPVAGLGTALVTVPLGVLAALGGSILLGLLLEQLGMRVQEQSSVLEITEGVVARGFDLQASMLVLAALVLAPIAEEWLFRGLLFRRVTAVSGRGLAYAVSALGFAAIHGNPAGFVVYLWLGLVFAAVLERSGRLWTAVLVHMGNNGFVLALLFSGSELAG
ncbi:CPBP family intramembrane glutamic endopeptidase [Paraliomyxa miuraensis]|uniref:CPBP family intramembrane glutamic endopeptidase n=1 Tax=Paraliomyxa miuraensis TaxID=376150 RepID=UPI002253F174|nr:CPBP family intramembrane glutamic endopeptidase [Paraliomyxa miuraensis]MCX4241543.1 CPBP family intramembrane metalloprotease [Paraliomyxa miuraensis]